MKDTILGISINKPLVGGSNVDELTNPKKTDTSTTTKQGNNNEITPQRTNDNKDLETQRIINQQQQNRQNAEILANFNNTDSLTGLPKND